MFSRNFSRNFSVINCLQARFVRKGKNPGLGRQITALEEIPPEFQDDPEGFGNIESDFANAHKFHKGYDIEQSRQRDVNRQYVIKSKYFASEKLPNFLTYAEKEHIRLLHNKDEEQWSVESLAESFPATIDIIRKVIKSNWKVSSAKRIHAHDKGVSKNWDLFQKGVFQNQLPKELEEHLKKFINRRLMSDQDVVPTTKESLPISNEFSSILGTRRRQAESSDIRISAPNMESSQGSVPTPTDEDTYLLDKVKGKKYIRVQELKESKLNLEHTSQKCVSNTSVVDDANENFSLTFAHKFAVNEVVISETDKKLYDMSKVKDRIYIPRKLMKKGAIYRIDDCYYDNDGEFLYRVPGMKD